MNFLLPFARLLNYYYEKKNIFSFAIACISITTASLTINENKHFIRLYPNAINRRPNK